MGQIRDRFSWESNGASISGCLHAQSPGSEPSDVIELTVHPANGDEMGWYMNLEDALAIIAILSRLVFLLQVGEHRLERRDGADLKE